MIRNEKIRLEKRRINFIVRREIAKKIRIKMILV